jgi:hypothetical protein
MRSSDGSKGWEERMAGGLANGVVPCYSEAMLRK